MRIISASVDLLKIDKSRIEEKNGKKYYNITIIVNDEPNQFGQDVGITTEQTKIERESKTPKVYLGNGKTVFLSNTLPPKLEDNTVQEENNLPF